MQVRKNVSRKSVKKPEKDKVSVSKITAIA